MTDDDPGTSGANGPKKPNANSSGMLVASLLGTGAWVGLALFKTTGSGSDAFAQSLLLAVFVCMPLVALGLIALHVVKGRARRIAAFTGSRAFLVLGNTNTGVDQLRTVDGYAVPFVPVVTVREGSFEIWRSVDEGRPIASIPVHAMTVDVGRQWAVYPHAAFVLTIVGIDEPVYFSLYGDRWWSLLTMGREALEETGREIGLVRSERAE